MLGSDVLHSSHPAAAMMSVMELYMNTACASGEWEEDEGHGSNHQKFSLQAVQGRPR